MNRVRGWLCTACAVGAGADAVGATVWACMGKFDLAILFAASGLLCGVGLVANEAYEERKKT